MYGSLITLLCERIIISVLSYLNSQRQISADYDAAVLLAPGLLPIKNFSLGVIPFNFEVTNTSKDNIKYFLKIESNFILINGELSKPQSFPLTYESEIIALSKPEAGNHKMAHKVKFEVMSADSDSDSLAYFTAPTYYLDVEVINAKNGKMLFQSTCYYSYWKENHLFRLDEPVTDSSGESKKLQSNCIT